MPDPLTGRPTRAEREAVYASLLEADPRDAREASRHLARYDLYFLLTQVCGQKEIRHDWLYERVQEVEAAPDEHIDLWARFHFKSSIITQGLSLQEILRNPNITICILSYNRPLAKTFLRWIKREFETNETLKDLFPEVCWVSPSNQAPQWSEDSGIIVKRSVNVKEATVEAYGLVDSPPVGRHPRIVVYDDVVVSESVTTPEQIAKTTKAFQESLAIGGSIARRRIIGTRWHYADTYHEIIQTGAFKPRIYPARGKDGKPVWMTEEALAKLYKGMTAGPFAAQMLLDPKTESELGFSEKHIKYYRDHRDGHGMNLYLIVDPANSKKKDSSYTAMILIGLGHDGNYYWLDGLRDRIGPNDRIQALFALHRAWQSKIGSQRKIIVGWESYGTQQADVELIQREQERQMYRFPVIELRGREGKNDRIARLEPDYIDGRWYWPERLAKTRKNGQHYDMVQEFKNEEFLAWPFSRHPDVLDAKSRILDPVLGATFPKPQEFAAADRYDEGDWDSPRTSPWAA